MSNKNDISLTFLQIINSSLVSNLNQSSLLYLLGCIKRDTNGAVAPGVETLKHDKIFCHALKGYKKNLLYHLYFIYFF